MPPSQNPQEHCCPYLKIENNLCRASTSGLHLDAIRRTRYCQSDNFDLCPLFLSRQLRNSRSRDYPRHVREQQTA